MFSKQFLDESINILKTFDHAQYEKFVEHIGRIQKTGGRIFFLGVGGSAANCSHSVNDFRKILNIESYAPTDNVSEVTARTNDDGWESIFQKFLETSKLNSKDLIIILSVGGGCEEKNISVNLIRAVQFSKKVGAKILGIVGKSTGYTAREADITIVINSKNENHLTPHSESIQSVILHMVVSDPRLNRHITKWESLHDTNQ